MFPHCSGATRSHPSTRAYGLGNGVLRAARNAGGAGVCGVSPSINCNGSALVSRMPLAPAPWALKTGECEMDEECPPVRTGPKHQLALGRLPGKSRVVSHILRSGHGPANEATCRSTETPAPCGSGSPFTLGWGTLRSRRSRAFLCSRFDLGASGIPDPAPEGPLACFGLAVPRRGIWAWHAALAAASIVSNSGQDTT